MSVLEKLPVGAKIRITQHYVEFRSGGSNKFYRTLVLANENEPNQTSSIIMNWGAIGAAGQSKVIHGLTAEKAYRDTNRKISEKKAKGYTDATPPRDREAGIVGKLNSHVFGHDKLKDKEAFEIIRKTVGDNATLEKFLDECHVYDARIDAAEAERLRLLEEEKQRERERLEREKQQAIESERAATYSSAWGEWA